MNRQLEQEITTLHAEICAGLADPTRILILYELSEQPKNVSELAYSLNVPQPTISRHLKVLRDRAMVTTHRHGQAVEYQLGDRRLIEALDLLRGVMRDQLSSRAALIERLQA
jgi:DNA-binding transcriptional ArsR family regulator